MFQPYQHINLKAVFDQKKPLFIPFIMAGDPALETTFDALSILSKQGADIIELGIPFSDPIADGPINQRAAEIALSHDINITSILNRVEQLRKQGILTPLILFTYLNPILAFGIASFAEKAKAAGVNGVLIVDLPPEEGSSIYKLFKDFDLEIVLLISPTTERKRLPYYFALNPAFLYYISRLGVTGVQDKLSSTLAEEVQTLRKSIANIPIAIGFGISTPEQAKAIAQIGDGVVIGSRLVETLEKEGLSGFSALVQRFREAIVN